MRNRKIQVPLRLNEKEFKHLQKQVDKSCLNREKYLRSLILGHKIYPQPCEEYLQILKLLSSAVNNIDKIATYYGTEHFVVGHTVVDYISSLYNEKVIAIDLKQPTFPKEGKAKALYMEGGTFYKVDEDGKRELL